MKNEISQTGTRIHFREITEKTLFEILKLSNTLSANQKKMVAPNSVSIAEAHFHEHTWFRGIYAGDRPIGFIMIENSRLMEGDTGEDEPFNGWFLWRFMIAGTDQGNGYGRKALDLLVEMMKKDHLEELRTSCGKGEGSPLEFYRKYGFELTGREFSGETELLLKL